MDLRRYVDEIHRQLAVATAAVGDGSVDLAERLVASLDAGVRLTLQDVLAAAAEEITVQMAPGAVELRLRGRDPEFVVVPPPAESEAMAESRPSPVVRSEAEEDTAVSRINLRLPDHVKVRIERAADAEGLSINSWLVRAASNALDHQGGAGRQETRGSGRYTGWVR